MNHLSNEWKSILKDEFKKDYFSYLQDQVNQEYQKRTVYPPYDEIFSALNYTSYESAKVVIIGQDPYHGENQAHGLSFSVRPGNRIPPSLRNIYKELKEDLGIEIPRHGYLVSWAEQGVLLLNDVLTVRAGEANSHRALGWEKFTDAVIQSLNKRSRPLVFILWGKHAQKKGAVVDRDKHLVLTSSHPSPFAAHRGFYGSRPFSKANQFLKQNGMDPVDWSLPKR
ncbi:uracil-DNA glycosylase [Halobacillus karajensis]|uniref:Uracil-DNA glycosylase n=1 Tax=Halobacillus karajensis TaxID=195088 RepID=A0A024P2A4_9BACI|nr:uracil-DNA glycosylase [Halobacillus karajensis]CDQ19569.1 Uracil-DNA glycosylase [Halobacillus karajensis]CDQ22031.1 Uracil-DNA glycosylase [Halobacillus karajensis]CDQ27872.1 Uracil-DNA glycosylase [Halobacillus karajensis]